MRYRIKRAQVPSAVTVAISSSVPAPVARGPRLRVRRSPLELIAAPPIPQTPPPKRRGRAPAHIPDPWADLEWDVHEEAQRAVREHPAGMTLEEIGAKMNITRERVRQIENSALRKLRESGGGDITWIGALTVATPDCRRCGEPFVRKTGRQELCDICESKRRKKRPHPSLVASASMCA